MGDEVRQALLAEEGGRRWLRRGILGLVLAALIVGGLVARAKSRPPPAARYMTAEASVGDVVEKVLATGTVQPVLSVNVGAQVSGRVATVPVDFNSEVKKGDVLAEIDPVVYSAQVSRSNAELAAARANVESAKASHAAAKAAYERAKRLHEQNLASRGELDTALGQFEVTRAQVASAEAQIAAIQAQLRQSATNVGWTKILSPVDGVVVTRNVDPGATVVASFQAPVLFVLAKDLRKMRVMADVDEADVGKLKEGMEAEAVVDAFPGESFRGAVQQVRYSPNNVQGVVTYSAVVEVDNPDDKLRPGMTATVSIKTREAKGAVRVPNAALRFKPTPPEKKGSDKAGPPPPAKPEEKLGKGEGRVFVVTSDVPGDEKAEPRIVKIGVTDGAFTAVLDALPAGTKVVTDETDEKDESKKRRSRLF